MLLIYAAKKKNDIPKNAYIGFTTVIEARRVKKNNVIAMSLKLVSRYFRGC
jgi:hypothetical protein